MEMLLLVMILVSMEVGLRVHRCNQGLRKELLEIIPGGGYEGKAWDPMRLGPASSLSKGKGGNDPTFPAEEHRKTRTLPPSFLAEQKKQKKQKKKKKNKEEKKEEK